MIPNHGSATSMPVCFSSELIPTAWLEETGATNDDFRVYNPAIVRFRSRLLMAYRVDSGRRQTAQRRIGLCELDEQLQVIPGSVRPLSDSIQGGDPFHYDPRFLIYQDRLFIHYNNNHQTRPNQIFLVELDPDRLEARSRARPLEVDGVRQEIEKNWMLFDHEGDLLAVYSIAPHVILRVHVNDAGSVLCQPAFKTTWEVAAYAEHYGQPRGGAPPVRYEDVYISVFHSHRLVGALRHLLPLFPNRLIKRLPRFPAAAVRRLQHRCYQRRYFGGIYIFAATPPFRPLWLAHEPLLRPEVELPRQRPRRIDPTSERAVYPAGAVLQPDNGLLVSYGVNEERCCLRRIDLDHAFGALACKVQHLHFSAPTVQYP